MLRSVRDLLNLRFVSADGSRCGLVKDVYFDDHSWALKHLVVALDPRFFGNRQVLLAPAQLTFSDDSESLQTALHKQELALLPGSESVLPVCRQYAAFSLASPGASALTAKLRASDPCLRSIRAVSEYTLFVGGEAAGRLADLLFDDAAFEFRYLAVEQTIERRKVRFHILPQSVERFTWATQRVLLRSLQAVEIASEQVRDGSVLAA